MCKCKNNDQSDVVHRHNFELNHNDSDEKVSLETEFHANGDPGGVFWNQFLTIDNYHHNNRITLSFYNGLFNPSKLRELADQLEAAKKTAIEMTR